MRYFIDLEFIERGAQHPIDLISIGIVDENEWEYYAINYNCNFEHADNWVTLNVVNALPRYPQIGIYVHSPDAIYKPSEDYKNGWRSRSQIKEEILEFVGKDKSPEFWGEWCAYDWVVFAQLFGAMDELPEHFPMRCNDIIQFCEHELGLGVDALPPSLETDGNHNALLGARTVRDRYNFLLGVKNNKKLQFLEGE